jgi:cell division protease FtsH
MGMLSNYHSKVKKVVINLSSPSTPGYTLFDESNSALFTKEMLFDHLAILLSGRIAEEIVYNVSITTGAINDFEEAYNLAEKMILYYGMGTQYIFPKNSEKYKEIIDNEILCLITEAQKYAETILLQSKDFIIECADLLKKEKILTIDTLNSIIYNKYNELLFIN